MTEASEGAGDPPTEFRGNEEVIGDLFDLSDPQPRYRSLIEMGGVLSPTEGFTLVASRSAVD